MLGRHGGDLDAALGPVQVGGLVRLQADRVSAEALGPCQGCEDAPGARQKVAAGVIEVVRVMVVGEQHQVDRGEFVGSDRRTGELVQDDRRPRTGVVAGRVEGGIRQDVQATVGEQGGRPADRLDGRGRGFGHAPSIP